MIKKVSLGIGLLFIVGIVGYFALIKDKINSFSERDVIIKPLSDTERKALNLSTKSFEILDNQPFQYHKISFKNYPFSLVLPRAIWESDKENIDYHCESFKEKLRNSIEEMQRSVDPKYPLSQINFLKKRLQETSCQEGYRINTTTGDNNQEEISLYTLVNENGNNINISLSIIALEKVKKLLQKYDNMYFVSGENKFRRIPLSIYIPHQEDTNLVYELSSLSIRYFDENHMAILYD